MKCPNCNAWNATFPRLDDVPEQSAREQLNNGECRECRWSWASTHTCAKPGISRLRLLWSDDLGRPRLELVLSRRTGPAIAAAARAQQIIEACQAEERLRAEARNREVAEKQTRLVGWAGPDGIISPKCETCGGEFAPHSTVFWSNTLHGLVHQPGTCSGVPVRTSKESLGSANTIRRACRALLAEATSSGPQDLLSKLAQELEAEELERKRQDRERLAQAGLWMAHNRPPAPPPSQPERPAKPASVSGRLAAWACRCWELATLPVLGVVAFLGMAWGRTARERLPGEYEDR